MQRFYFNVITANNKLRDLEGTELPDLATAESEAIEDVRVLISTEK